MALHLVGILIFIADLAFGVEIFPPSQEVIIPESVDAVTLPCSYQSQGAAVRTQATIRWTIGDRDGRLVLSSDQYSTGVPGGRFSGRVRLGQQADLILAQPTVSDSASYTCSVHIPTDTVPTAWGKVILLATECARPDTVAVGICVTLDVLLLGSAILWFILSSRRSITEVKLYRRILRLVTIVSALACTASAIVLIIYACQECVQGLQRLRVAGILFCVVSLLLAIIYWLLTARKFRGTHGQSAYNFPQDELESAEAENQKQPVCNDKAMLEHHRPGSGSGSVSPTDKVSQGDFATDVDKAVYDDMVKILPNKDTGSRARRFEELRTRDAFPSQTDRYLAEPMQIMDHFGGGRSPTSIGPDEVFYPPRGPKAAPRLGRDNNSNRAPVPEREQPRVPSHSAGKPTNTQPNPTPTPTPRQNGGVNRSRPTETVIDPPGCNLRPTQDPLPRKTLLSLPATGHPVALRDKGAMRKARSMEVLKRGLSLPVLNEERRSQPLSIEEKIDQDIFLEDCKKTADYFVETTTYRTIEKLLKHKDTHGVTLTGGPGTGKTASAMYAAWKLHSTEGYLPLKVRTIAEIERIYIEGLKLIFVVDDPFGKLCASSELQEYWRSSAKRLQACLSTDNVKIIATVRSDIWAVSQYSVMRYPPFSSAVEISGKLTLMERRAMLEKHLGLVGMHPSEPSWADVVRMITLPAIPPIFPLCCQLVKTSESFRGSATALFYKPTDTIRKDMHNLRTEDPEAFCVLSLMLVHGGKLSRTVLSRPLNELPAVERDKIEQIWKACSRKPSSAAPSPEDLQQKEDKLAKIYIEKTETSLQFSLTSFADVALLEMADLNLQLVMRWCHPDVIAGKLVALTDPSASQTVVVVNPEHWPQLAKVLTNELLAGNVKAILDNPSWKSDDFVVSWKKNIVTDSIREKLRSVSGWCSQGEIVHRAARQGLLAFLRVLLQDVTLGKNGVRLRNEYGQSLLHSAAVGGHTNTAQFLLDKGCLVDAVNDAGESPLYLASLHGHTAVIDLLLQNKANPDLTSKLGLGPLHAAVFGEHTEAVFTLASHVSGETLGSSSRSKIAITSFRDKFLCALKHSGLHEAARTSDLVRIHHLLDNGFDKNAQNKYGWSPLYITVILGHVEATALLLTRGANPNITSHQGTAPLDEACGTFNDPLVALLLSYGTKRSSCI